jgi:uncharacterized protein (TIGR03118 family)
MSSINDFSQTNIVSDIPGTAAFTYPQLQNPWGLVLGDDYIWVAVNGSKQLVKFTPEGAVLSTVTTTGAPTGLVSAVGTAFNVALITVTEDGTIETYTSGAATIVKATIADAVYKGAAIHNGYLYATNFSQKRVDVFDSTFTLVPALSMAVTDIGLTSITSEDDISYSPFGIYSHKCRLFISYAQKNGDDNDDTHGIGNGYIDVYRKGNLSRLVSRGPLNSPWGMSFRDGILYVGNFGDGVINTFELKKCLVTYCNTLRTECGGVIVNDGLWAVVMNCCGVIYITAGSQDENHGLIAYLSPEQEDSC